MHLLCKLVNVKILFFRPRISLYICLFYLDAFRILAGTFITDYLCIELRYDHKIVCYIILACSSSNRSNIKIVFRQNISLELSNSDCFIKYPFLIDNRLFNC